MKNIILGIIAAFTFGNQVNAQSKKEFNEDSRINELINHSKSLQSLTPKEAIKILELKKIIESNIKGLFDTYGTENVMVYVAENINDPDIIKEFPNSNPSEIGVNGDNCHRNSNGSVHWNGCSFWGTIKALLGSFGCQEPYPGGGSAASQANTYYDCVQESICHNC